MFPSMGLATLADRMTSRRDEGWAVTREETPRRFHVRRTVGIAVLSVVTIFLPLGPNRLWVSAAIISAGLATHAIHKLVPNRNVDGATQWTFVATALISSAIVPALLPAAALATATDLAGGSRTFTRKLNYLWVLVTAIGLFIIGLTADVPYWPAVFATFVVSIPGSIELGEWRSERTEIQRQRMQMLSKLGQAITWESHVATDELLWVDGPVKELLGIEPSELIEMVNHTDAISPLAGFRREGKDRIAGIRHADGTPRWFKINGQLRTRADGEEILYGVSVDITDIELARRHEQKRAEHDTLTGLANRAGLAKFLDGEAHRVGKAVLVADIDQFKDVNDSLGHIVGDRLISAVAGRLSNLASPDRLVARLGGDEFAVAVVGDSVEQVKAEAETLATELSEVLSDGFAVQEMELHITASIGMAAGGDLDWTELLRRADGVMYEAKREGVGFKWYDHLADSTAVEQIQLQADLTRGLEEEVVLYYQPLVSATSHQIVGVESLARWVHPERGLIFPDTFLPIIEKSGMTARFDSHILQTAVAAASELATSGQTITVSVNLSPRSLWSPKLLMQLRELLSEHPLARERLIIEVTEQGLHNDFSRSLPLFESLRAMGVRLSLDDFGTGGSSLIRLRSLPFDEIKVDKSFVDGVPGEGIDATIVKSTIELANALGMSTVAEGVETIEQAEELAGMGCLKLQGWAFAKAMPLDELFETWVNVSEPELAK